MNAIVEIFLANALKSIIFAGLVLLISLLPMVRNLVAVQHSLWMLVLLAMIAPPLIDLPVLSPAQEPISAIANTNQPSQSSPSIDSVALEFTDDHQFASTIVNHNDSSNRIATYLLVVMLTGMAIILTSAASAARRLERTLRLAMPANEQISLVASQAAQLMGIRKPIVVSVVSSQTSPFIWVDRKFLHIVLPQEVCNFTDPADLRRILLHELAHYKRRDHWSNTIALLVLSICWWNPLAWIASLRLRTLQEYCCDAIAIEKSRTTRRDYAQCLYRIVESIQPKPSHLPTSVCAFLGGSAVEQRFRMIANPKLRFEVTRWNYLVVLLCLALLPCTLAYSQSPSPDKPTEQVDANEHELTQWHDILDRFNRLAKDANWTEAEQLANETANKFGHENTLVQKMLFTSLNGLRKSQGLSPILADNLSPNPNRQPVRYTQLYRVAVPSDEYEQTQLIKVLKQCILASIAQDAGTDNNASVGYDEQTQSILVSTSKKPHLELVSDILKRLPEKSTR